VTSQFIASIRFDNMSNRTTSVPSGYEGELRANTPDEVKGVLRQAEEAARQGVWVAGYVSHESAPAFDASLLVRQRSPDSFPGLPQAWFGLLASCITTPRRLARDEGHQGRALAGCSPPRRLRRQLVLRPGRAIRQSKSAHIDQH
jgi:hypothetical protein